MHLDVDSRITGVEMKQSKTQSTNDAFFKVALQVLLGLAVFIALDLIGIAFVAEPLYSKQLGALMVRGSDLDWRVGLSAWALIVLGYRVFAYPRAIASSHIALSAFWGGLYGFILYGMFTLTNLAILRCWSPAIVVCDLASGVVLCSLLSLFMCRYRFQ